MALNCLTCCIFQIANVRIKPASCCLDNEIGALQHCYNSCTSMLWYIKELQGESGSTGARKRVFFRTDIWVREIAFPSKIFPLLIFLWSVTDWEASQGIYLYFAAVVAVLVVVDVFLIIVVVVVDAVVVVITVGVVGVVAVVASNWNLSGFCCIRTQTSNSSLASQRGWVEVR